MERIYFNDDWKFTEKFSMDLCKRDFNEETLETVRLPHTNKITSFNYFHEGSYEMTSGYRKIFKAEEGWKDKHVLITFEGVAHEAFIYLNEKEVISHQGGYTSFTVDISPYLDFEKENVLAVKVDSHESLNMPPFGNVIDYMTYGGIYREVFLQVKEKTYISDVFVFTKDVNREEKSLHIEVTLNGQDHGLTIEQSVVIALGKENGENIVLGTEAIKSITSKFKKKVSKVDLWDIENPNLYYLDTKLYKNGQLIDINRVRFGFREVAFKKDGFYLNGKKIKIRGFNRHQSYPYVGYAMPKSPQVRDADLLKNELGVNAVRTSHYPQSQYFIDRCDEIGILVFTEIPGWQHIGDDRWKSVACNNVEEMVLQYRNHPSIFIWGVRINESADDDEFYKRTNEIAHNLDPSRPTGGVRCIKGSHLLEDVYTYNDFLHDGKSRGLEKKKKVTSNMEKPYMITEYNGHMFPTKTFDSEEHRLEHALRHTRVLNSLYGDEEIAGAFAWCMFDYNTHKDFGSGDRICYHGVMDMFRNHKLASAPYRALSDKEVVLEISSTMDIGEHPGSFRGEIYAFTNADSIKIYKNHEFIKEYRTGNSSFENLSHGPILIDDLIGEQLEKHEGYSKKKSEAVKRILGAVSKYGLNNLPFSTKLLAAKLIITQGFKVEDGVRLFSKYVGNWGVTVTTYRFEAIKDGQVVKVVTKKPMKEVQLEVDVDKTRLTEDTTYDVASIRIKAVDENDNLLNFYNEAISLEVVGELEIIGPKIITLKGGMGGTYVKTTGKSGSGNLKISGEGLKNVELKFHIEK